MFRQMLRSFLSFLSHFGSLVSGNQPFPLLICGPIPQPQVLTSLFSQEKDSSTIPDVRPDIPFSFWTPPGATAFDCSLSLAKSIIKDGVYSVL